MLTAVLAEKAFGWKSSPDRFIRPGRSWLPRWRFRPFAAIADSFELLDAVHPDSYSLECIGSEIVVSVSIGGRIGEARSKSRPEAISLAIASAYGLLSPGDVASARPKRSSR